MPDLGDRAKGRDISDNRLENLELLPNRQAHTSFTAIEQEVKQLRERVKQLEARITLLEAERVLAELANL